MALPAPSAHRRVLILVDKPGDPFMGRIKAEIVGLGLDVAMHPPVGSLDSDARAEHAAAAIRMLPSRKGVEVWMADETSGRSLLRQVIVDETPGGPDRNLIALQTAELLRTSFFPKNDNASARGATHSAQPPSAAVAAGPQAQPSGESAVQVGFGVLSGAGGTGTALQAWLAYQHLWSHRLGIALDLSAPLRRGTLSGPEGTADVGAVLAGGELLARFRTEGGRLFLTTALGAALASLIVKGQPSAQTSSQLTGSSANVYTGLVFLRLNAGWSSSGGLGLGVTGVVGTTTAHVHLRFAGNDAGSWGLPVLGALLYGQVGWR